MGPLSIRHSDVSLIDLYEEGRLQNQREGGKRKGGYFAGGTCGCIVNIGGVEYTIGSHPLKALARYLGYQAPVTRKSLNIFDSGFQNEWSWEQYLGNKFNFSFRDKHTIAGVDIFTEYDLMNFEVVGELKGIMSNNTATSVIGKWEPKTENLIQAGLYSMLSGKPANLVYTQGSNFGKLKADKIEFKLGFDKGTLYFVSPDGTGNTTIITAKGIEEYYDDVKYLAENKMVTGFNRGHYDYKGDVGMDWDRSDHMMIVLDGVKEWDDYINRLEKIVNTSFVLSPKWGRGLKVVGYYLTNLGDCVIEEYETLKEAQEGFFNL